MIRGTITFKCEECGEKFKGLDIEYMATVFSVPQQCPKCKSYHTMPAGIFTDKSIYRKIWENQDKENATRNS